MIKYVRTALNVKCNMSRSLCAKSLFLSVMPVSLNLEGPLTRSFRHHLWLHPLRRHLISNTTKPLTLRALDKVSALNNIANEHNIPWNAQDFVIKLDDLGSWVEKIGGQEEAQANRIEADVWF